MPSALGLVVFAGLVVLNAAAMERVNLRNGFSYDCARQEPLDSAHVRLILNSPGPADAANFVDLPMDAIASVETLPDPPPQQRATPLLAGAAPAEMHLLLNHAGEAHDIDVELLASVVHAESGGHPLAVSRTGAQGLMQLMPATARQLGVNDAFRPDSNINGGTAYLDELLTRYHDNLALALAAYNAGPAAVDRFHGVPPYRETRAYVARVMTEFRQRKLALAHATRAAR